jgi:ABC-type proline/glycine betaine transport system permease subunit
MTGLPEGAKVLATSPDCTVQAMSWGPRALSMQFHLEFEADTVRNWTAIPAYRNLLDGAFGPDGADRLALLSFLYGAFFHLWKDAMRTMTIVLVAVPMAAMIGLALGVWVTRSKRAAAIITPMFDLMQAIPHLAYLPPVAALFSFGPVLALIATVIFAMPPMARGPMLGLQSVPSDIIESGRMSGCTQRQLLWKVALPSSKRTLMMGLNQVVMQTFAMVVIASIVGASGLVGLRPSDGEPGSRKIKTAPGVRIQLAPAPLLSGEGPGGGNGREA